MVGLVLTDLLLKRLRLNFLVDKEFPRLHGDCSLAEAAQFLDHTSYSSVAVVDPEQKLLGVLKASDLSKETPSEHYESIPITKLVQEPQLTLRVEQAAQYTLGWMLEEGFREVLIVDRQNRFIGAIVVSESMSAELTITKQLKAILEGIVENPNERLVIVDENSKIVMMNKFYLEVSSISDPQILGQKYLARALERTEKELIANVLRLTNGNKVLTAQTLGIHRSVLYKKLAKYNLNTKQ